MFAHNGYKDGVRWLSIKYENTGCTNGFGVTNKSDKIYRAERMFPELIGLEQDKDTAIWFRQHNGSVISIKLDCDTRQVTFYNDYSRKICKKPIYPNEAYWFSVSYCICKGSEVCFEIVQTEFVKV